MLPTKHLDTRNTALVNITYYLLLDLMGQVDGRLSSVGSVHRSSQIQSNTTVLIFCSYSSV